jgi:hypothetical protein
LFAEQVYCLAVGHGVDMTKSALFLGISLALAWPALADPESANSDTIPDFSGGWARIGDLVETFEPIPGSTAGGPVLVDPKHPHEQGGDALEWVAALDNPILKPETRAKLRTITQAEIEGVPHLKDEGLCLPSGVPMILNRRGGAIKMLQTPSQVTIINARDQQARFVYLNVPHSKNPAGHSWYGESVGHYENGDTLVVDTIGQNDKTQIDRFGTPHSNQIHVVERYRLSADHRAMEVQFTVDDPGAFTMPWSGRARFAARRTDWDEQVCAENNRFVGTVTVGGKKMTTVPTPTSDKPDF